MLSCAKLLYEVEKPVYVKERTRENARMGMTVNRAVVFLVFASGVIVAVIGTLLSQYIRGSTKELPGKRRFFP